MKETEIIKRIGAFIEEKELTQKELAKAIGVSQSVVSETLKGKRSAKTLAKKISKFYDIPLYQFTGEEETPEGSPYYNVDFHCGFDLVLNDQKTKADGYFKIPKYEKATCLCNISGHSMEPEINNGDIVVLRKLEDWHFLPFGEVYAFVTKNDMRMVKRIGPAKTEDSYILYSSNKSPEYAPQELKKEDILQVFQVMGCLKNL